MRYSEEIISQLHKSRVSLCGEELRSTQWEALKECLSINTLDDAFLRENRANHGGKNNHDKRSETLSHYQGDWSNNGYLFPICVFKKCSLVLHRWAQVTRFLVIVDEELNRTPREFRAERRRTDLLSNYTPQNMGVEQASSQQRLTSGAGGLLLLQGGYFLARFGELLLCRYKELYDFKATAHDFP